MTPETVVDFWTAAGLERWFAGEATFDAEVRIKFGAALSAAREGSFDHWAASAAGALGLVILLDQMSRNIHRGTPLSFAADAKALALAKGSIGRGWHRTLPAPLARWLIL